ncbi:MAG: hypothetical protein R2824_30660 [Saprospiraceae bacterium]|nr:hypothetical protein [Lewinella sp.]
MFFVMPINRRDKPRFDAYVDGILLDNNDELATNSFIYGAEVKEEAGKSYKIKTNQEFSEIGKIKDRLVTKVHNTPIFIVSENFKELLQNNFSGQAEFFEVKFDIVNKKPLEGYFICNILSIYNCIDYENSIVDYEFYDENEKGHGQIYTIDSMVIDESKIPIDAHIFLLGNFPKPIILVSQEMRNAIEDRGITGFSFVNPEDFMI